MSSSAARTILLTGATGRIGPYVLDNLVRQGYKIRIATPDPVPETDVVSWRKTDFLVTTDYEGLVRGVDAIVHLAAEIWDISKMHAVNVHATERLAEEAERQGVKCFVYASSVTVYGFPAHVSIDESAPPLPVQKSRKFPYLHKPFMRQYALTKWEGEEAIRRCLNKTKAVALRFSNVTTENDIEHVLRNYSWKERLWRGYRYTHQVYVKDVAAVILFMLARLFDNDKEEASLEIYNVSEDREGIGRYIDLFRQYGAARGCVICYCPFYFPKFFDFIKDRFKYKTLSWALPAGAVLYSPDRLFKLGFKYPYGIARVQREVIARMVRVR